MRQGKAFAAVLLVLGASCVSACLLPKSASEYAEDFRSDVQARRFKQIYANAAFDITERCSEREFVRRVEILAEEIKKLDPSMQWSKSYEIGNSADGRKRLSESNLLYAYRDIVSGEKRMILLLYWTDENGSVQLAAVNAVHSHKDDLVESYDIPRTCLPSK